MKAGYGEAIITPEPPCPLTGYGVYMGRRAQGVLDELKVRALYLEAPASRREGSSPGTGGAPGAAQTELLRVAILAYDLVGFSVARADRLRRRAAALLSCPPEAVFVSATHTHSGPPTMFLRGMGEMDVDYLSLIESRTLEALEQARRAAHAVRLSAVIEEVEPIGYNRVEGTLCPLDTSLGLLNFEPAPQERAAEGQGEAAETITLANHACHPVTLGPNHQLSADFPGRFCRSVEEQGAGHAIFLQGFCGNVDPMVNRSHWGEGTEAEIAFYGRHLAELAGRLHRHARPLEDPGLGAGEVRIDLPLVPPPHGDLDSVEESFRASYHAQDPGGVERFLAEWREEAERSEGVLQGVPVSLLEIGEAAIIGIPGEVFCEIGLQLRARRPLLFTAGYTNGNIGYIPTREAYRRPENYACYKAPLFYRAFPFSPEIERLVVEAAQGLL